MVDSDPEHKPPRPTRKRASPAAAKSAAGELEQPVEREAPATPAADASPRPRWLRRWVPLGAAALVVVGLVVAVIVLAVTVSDDAGRQDARRSAIAAARSYAADIASYDYRSLDKDFARVTAHSTGTFRGQFAKASKDLKPLIEQYHATATGKVIAVGLSKSSTDRATAVVFVDQTVTNDNAKTPRVDRNRMTMDLVRRNGTWLISGVQLV